MLRVLTYIGTGKSIHVKINIKKKRSKMSKFEVGDKAIKPKGYAFPCTVVGVFETLAGNTRVVGEMDEYGLLHIFNENQLEPATDE